MGVFFPYWVRFIKIRSPISSKKYENPLKSDWKLHFFKKDTGHIRSDILLNFALPEIFPKIDIPITQVNKGIRYHGIAKKKQKQKNKNEAA